MQTSMLLTHISAPVQSRSGLGWSCCGSGCCRSCGWLWHCGGRLCRGGGGRCGGCGGHFCGWGRHWGCLMLSAGCVPCRNIDMSLWLDVWHGWSGSSSTPCLRQRRNWHSLQDAYKHPHLWSHWCPHCGCAVQVPVWHSALRGCWQQPVAALMLPLHFSALARNTHQTDRCLRPVKWFNQPVTDSALASSFLSVIKHLEGPYKWKSAGIW